MANELIREKAKKSGVMLWQIADRLGIYDTNFSKKLRSELSQDETNKILAIIDEIKECDK